MRRLPLAVAVAALVSTAVVAEASVVCPPVVAEPLAFGEPVVIDPNAAGGEPVSVVAQDGSITVSAHAGTTHLFKSSEAATGSGDFVVGYANQTINWRSTDGGATWKRIGVLPPVETGPHSVTSSGFSDPDLTIDQGGTLYNTEINLPHVSVYSSLDDGQTWPLAHPVASSGDRPWLVGAEPGEVFVATNLLVAGRPLLRSADGGITFQVVNTNVPFDGKPIVDPLNPEDGLIGPVGTSGFALSADDGRTWKVTGGAPLDASTQFFGTVAADDAGNIYLAAAGGYRGPSDINNTDGSVTVAVYERATGQWTGHVVPAPAGDALWPWIVAGSEGRVALTWLQRLPGSPQSFAVYAATTPNALGSTVECSDGSTVEVDAAWTVANASGGPVHVGGICLDGTACNLRLNSDRRLGDFLTINRDLEGRIFIAASTTVLPSVFGGPKPVANPVFFGQSGGPLLLEAPIPARPTRCAPLGHPQVCL